MIGSAIGAGMQVAGAIAGGAMQAAAYAKYEKALDNQLKENQNWYDRRYNEDATQRADAQRILSMTEESIKNRNKQAAATAAVMGGTEESIAADKAAGNDALANAAANIAVAGDARKDQIEQTYLGTKSDLQGKKNQMILDKANAMASAVQSVANTGASMASNWGKSNG